MLPTSYRSWRETEAFQPFNIASTNSDEYGRELHSSYNNQPQRWKLWLAALALLLAVIALIVASSAISASKREQSTDAAWRPPESKWQNIRRLAFGSCTAYDLRPQPIWDKVIDAQPDGWIWLGDFAYLDTALVDCAQVPSHPQCQCSAGTSGPPYFSSCMPIDPAYAQFRFQRQVEEPGYQRLLQYLCPSHKLGSAPPEGSNPEFCPKPLLGIYDDHDFGNNNADGRNTQKMVLKNLFLDAIGESADSPRRNAMTGLQTSYTLNEGIPGQESQVIMLDERWDRDAPRCSEAQLQCQQALKHPNSTGYARCQDLLHTGGRSGLGSCCMTDQHWGQLCNSTAGSSSSASAAFGFGVPRAAVCDPTSQLYGMRQAVLSADNATALANAAQLWEAGQGENWKHLLEADSPMCEVLGAPQRQWLQQQLAASSAPLRIIASGSVLAGSLGYETSSESCSGDDWECYPNAMVNFLHTIANVSTGCVVLLVGDYHYGDIKVIRPGAGQGYADLLQTSRLSKPVYQVMSSGMTNSTAHNTQKCEGSYLEDYVGLRPLGRCSYMPRPNFGMVEVDWGSGLVSLQVRDGETGGVADGYDGSRQEVKLSLRDCSVVE